MAGKNPKKVVYTAIVANVAIAVCKYVAAAITGSSAMLAEAFHSTADSGNELLLLLGMKRSSRPPDPLHPFGHGKALYFFSLLVAVYIFGFGALLAVHEGISHLRNPKLPDRPIWNYCVLLLAGTFEFYSWLVSYRELKRRKDPDESIWDQIIGSKDPTIFIVFLEDFAGVIGAFLALVAIFLGRVFKNPYLDPAASITIGLLLAVVAIFLARETGALLLGERTNRARLKKIREIITADPAVEEVGELLTMQLGPNEVLLTVNIQFRRDLNMPRLEEAIDRIEGRIRQAEPTIKRIFIEADSFTRGSSPPRAA